MLMVAACLGWSRSTVLLREQVKEWLSAAHSLVVDSVAELGTLGTQRMMAETGIGTSLAHCRWAATQRT